MDTTTSEYDGTKPAGVNVAAVKTVEGADRGLTRFDLRSSWIKSRRIELRDAHVSSTDDGEKIKLVNEDIKLVKETGYLDKSRKKLLNKRSDIVASGAQDATGYKFPGVDPEVPEAEQQEG